MMSETPLRRRGSWKEKHEKGACCLIESFDAPDRTRFGILEGVGGFDRKLLSKPLEIGQFSAGLRLVPEQIASTHFNPICASVTQV